MKIIKKITIIFIALSVMTVGCKDDFLETTPTNEISKQVLFQSVEGANTAIAGIMRNMYNYNAGSSEYHIDFGQKSIDLFLDMKGEDIRMYRSHWYSFVYSYKAYALTEEWGRPKMMWNYYYDIINGVNLILEGIKDISGEKNQIKNIKGQALAIRAMSYYYLSVIYCKTYKGNEGKPGVPVYTESGIVGHGRGTLKDVYTQIVKDMDEAVKLLDETVAIARPNKSIINADVAKGIYSRIALAMEDWAKAKKMASEARENNALMERDDYKDGFNNVENKGWMWGFDINSEQSTSYASFFSHVAPNVPGYAGGLGIFKGISKELYDQIKDGDVRKDLFGVYKKDSIEIGGQQTKFMDNGNGDWTDDYVMMRTAEMYLTEAEACARLGEEDQAKKLLKELRDSRFETETVLSDKTGQELINEILLERRIELWGEGFHFLDIKRNKLGVSRDESHPINVCTYYNFPAESDSFETQIPKDEINNNEAISEADQNPNPVPKN